ncbi:hypothetical protein BDA99DRAFT_539806 [Phascolomyces articulosus]|uniref:DUF726-domain-containing protein n=1 Tax=Phascolomyces articulosus TaxID=60185 RepID=A0AAD5PBP3_9FUNG|nr:hypothetical protein BDA99DRAFT_539806 [Phascolomyces articulosus]
MDNDNSQWSSPRHDGDMTSRQDDSNTTGVTMTTEQQNNDNHDSKTVAPVKHDDNVENNDNNATISIKVKKTALREKQLVDEKYIATSLTIPGIVQDNTDNHNENEEKEEDNNSKNKCGGNQDNNDCDQRNVAQNERPPSPPITVSSSSLSDIHQQQQQTAILTEATLAKQNKLMQEQERNDPTCSSIPLTTSNNAIRAWAATLPEIPDSVHTTPIGPSHIFELPSDHSPLSQHHDDDDDDETRREQQQEEEEEDRKNEPRIQETKDVFTDTQKIAYVGLCAVTSLEVVHDFQGKEFTYARMSADNWHRKLMRTIYMHMDISQEEQKMIESLARHDIRPTDLVHQFTAQGETTTINMGGYQKVQQPEKKNKEEEQTQQQQQQQQKEEETSRSSLESFSSATSKNKELNDKGQSKQVEEKEPILIETKSVLHEKDDILETTTSIEKNPTNNITTIETKDSLQQQQEQQESSASTGEIGSMDVSLDRGQQHDEVINTNANLTSSSSSSVPYEKDRTISPLPPSDTQTSNGAAIASSSQIGSNSVTHDTSLSEKQEATNEKEQQEAEAAKNGEFIIDLRWTVMCDLFLLCLSAENYDARSRVFIARMASYLELDWFQVIGFEKRITEHLMQNAGAAWETETVTSVATTQTYTTDVEVSIRNDVERKGRNKQRRKRRYIMIGLATIGGGLILGLSAGLMAPVIAGGIGTILTTVGVTGTSSFLGGTASIALITGGATAIGGTKRMRKRMKMINTFEFSPVTVDESVSCIVSISGWLPKGATKDTAALPFSTLDNMMGDHYTLYWEPEMLEALGSGLKIFATEAVTFSIQQALAHTIMGALLAGLAWPLALTKLGYLVDNPWNNGLDRARLAGLILADSLMNRNLGARPVTLVGYSLGARVIFYCLLELARVNAYGLVENVALFGTPVSASKQQWKECTTVVAGRFINGYASNDWLLGFLFRASTGGLGNVAGLRPLKHMEGDRVQNVDCTDLIKGHLSYRMLMPKLLKRAGFVVTSDELPDRLREREDDEDEFVIDLSGAKDLEQFRPATMVRGTSVSSLTSGKASIQYPPPKTKCHPPRTTEEAQQQLQQRQDQSSRTPSRSPSPSPSLQQQLQDSSSSPSQQQESPYHLSPEKQSPIGSPRVETTSPSPIDSPKSSLSTKTSSDPIESTNNNTNIPQEEQQSYPPPPEKQSSGDFSGNHSEAKTLIDGMSDQDIIADIIAKAAAVSKSSSNYSSLSSGRASIAQHPRPESPTMTYSSSDTTITSIFRASNSGDDTTHSSSSTMSKDSSSSPSTLSSPSRRSISSTSSLFGKSLLFNKNRKKSEEKGQQELSEQGIEVKELKSTLGRMVVPSDVMNPMPKFTLEKPNFARVNR